MGSIPGSGRSPGGGHGNPLQYFCLENPTDRGASRTIAMWSQRVGHTEWPSTAWRSINRIPLELGHCADEGKECLYLLFISAITGSIPWSGRPSWRWEWLPTSIFLPGEFHGQRSLAGYSPWGHKESDMTEQLILIYLLLLPSPGDLPDPRIEPMSPALQADSLPSESSGKLHLVLITVKTLVIYLFTLLISPL